VGLFAMLCNGFFGALLLMQQHEFARWYVQMSALGLAASALLLGLLHASAFSWATRRLSRIRLFEPIFENFRRIGRARPEWLPLIAVSFTFQLLAALVVYLAFESVGADIDIPTALLLTAAAGIASVLPISISGLGVVEGAIAGAAVALGVDYDSALLAAIILRLVTLPVSAACGLLYLTDRGQAPIASKAN
jgi:uncharacterized protein (TIRG00374 family)